MVQAFIKIVSFYALAVFSLSAIFLIFEGGYPAWEICLIALAFSLVAAGALVLQLALLRVAIRYHIGIRRRIRTEKGIETLEKIRIGGIDQWIQIRGHNRENPIILFLHGGPGAAEMGFSHMVQDAWEKHFVCVQWDQRGAGKTYACNDADSIKPTLTLEQMASDASEVVDAICGRLRQDRIILHGHSWGTALGIMLLHRRPEKFLAYVGEGQVVSMAENEKISYEVTLAEAYKRNHSRAIAELEALGSPPYCEGGYMSAVTAQRKWLRKFGLGARHKNGMGGPMLSNFYKPLLLSPDYSIKEVDNYMKALFSTGTAFTTGKAEYLHLDLRKLGYHFEVPIFFFSGRMDYVTPVSLSEEYFNNIQAPIKKLIWFEKSAHSPQREEPEKYLKEFLDHVLPATKRNGSRAH